MTTTLTERPSPATMAAMMVDAGLLDPFLIENAPTKKADKDKPLVVDFNLELVAKYNDAAKAFDDAEALKKLYGGQIKSAAEPLRIARCKRGVISTICLDGSLNYTAKNAWSKIDVKRGPDLVVFDMVRHFTDERETAIDGEALNANKHDPEVVAAFATLARKKILIQTRYYKPTERLFDDYTCDERIRALCVAQGILPQQALASPRKVSK